MPPSQFSEFSYGFAYTNELIFHAGGSAVAAPEFPSLQDEGRGKGYDVRVGLRRDEFVLQFKRGFRIERSTGKHWSRYGDRYYRFDIYPPSRSRQHRDLFEIAQTTTAAVAYVAPAFNRTRDLNRHFKARTVVANSRAVDVRSIGLLDREAHVVTYQGTKDAAIVHSQPFEVEDVPVLQLLAPRDDFLDREPQARRSDGSVGHQDSEPVPVEEAAIETVLRRAPALRGWADDQLGVDVAPLTVAQTLCRLVLGAELIVTFDPPSQR